MEGVGGGGVLRVFGPEGFDFGEGELRALFEAGGEGFEAVGAVGLGCHVERV